MRLCNDYTLQRNLTKSNICYGLWDFFVFFKATILIIAHKMNKLTTNKYIYFSWKINSFRYWMEKFSWSLVTCLLTESLVPALLQKWTSDFRCMFWVITRDAQNIQPPKLLVWSRMSALCLFDLFGSSALHRDRTWSAL